MNDMIQLFAIVLIIAIAIVWIIWFFGKLLGESQLHRDYADAYLRTQKAILEWEVCVESYLAIKDALSKLKLFACKSDEQIEVLETNFLIKYKKYVIDEMWNK